MVRFNLACALLAATVTSATASCGFAPTQEGQQCYLKFFGKPKPEMDHTSCCAAGLTCEVAPSSRNQIKKICKKRDLCATVRCISGTTCSAKDGKCYPSTGSKPSWAKSEAFKKNQCSVSAILTSTSTWRARLSPAFTSISSGLGGSVGARFADAQSVNECEHERKRERARSPCGLVFSITDGKKILARIICARFLFNC